MINSRIFNKTMACEQEWMQQRQLRVTASMVGAVVRARTEAVEKKLLEKHRSSEPQRCLPFPMQYGKIHESKARQLYVEFMNRQGFDVTVYRCGLIVSQEHPYIGATPDGLCKTNSSQFPLLCLEIKTVYDNSFVPLPLEDVVKNRSNFYLGQQKTGDLYVKRSHQYYMQIQTQLGVSKLKLAHLVVYLPRRQELRVFEVPFDPETWSNIVNKSESFFKRHMVSNMAELMDIDDAFAELKALNSEAMDVTEVIN